LQLGAAARGCEEAVAQEQVSCNRLRAGAEVARSGEARVAAAGLLLALLECHALAWVGDEIALADLRIAELPLARLLRAAAQLLALPLLLALIRLLQQRERRRQVARGHHLRLAQDGGGDAVAATGSHLKVVLR